MKKIGLFILALALIATYAFADGKDVTVKGTVIDNMCATKHAGDEAAITGHDKACALKCAAGGSDYSVYSEGKLIKLAPSSSAEVTEFLKMADSKTAVTIMGDETSDGIMVESIKNQ